MTGAGGTSGCVVAGCEGPVYDPQDGGPRFNRCQTHTNREMRRGRAGVHADELGAWLTKATGGR